MNEITGILKAVDPQQAERFLTHMENKMKGGE